LILVHTLLKMPSSSGFHEIPALVIRNVWWCGYALLIFGLIRVRYRQVQVVLIGDGPVEEENFRTAAPSGHY
jgi:hypothetical protein